MQEKNKYTFPLADLLRILKNSGYEVNTQQLLEIQSLLLSSPLLSSGPAVLKFIITPVIARNEEDQDNIYRIIDSFIEAQKQSEKKQRPGPYRWFKNRKRVFRIKVALFTLILLTAIVLYLMPERKIPATAPTDIAPPPLQKDTLRSALRPGQPADSAPQKNPHSAKPAPVSISGPVYSGSKIVPIPIDNNLQFSLVVGLALGSILYYLVFFEEKKRMKIKEQKSRENENMAGPPKENAPGLPVEGEKQSQSTAIRFPENDHLVLKPPVFVAIRASLKKPARIEFPGINIMASARATARNAGFPSILHNDEWKTRKYLLLTDTASGNAHITRLLQFLTRELTAGKIPFLKYTFSSDLFTVTDDNGNTVDLQNMSYRANDYHLMIISDCASFFKEGDTALKNAHADFFHLWQHKSVITPAPIADWSRREACLKNNQFLITPADTGSIRLLANAISENETLSNEKLKKQLVKKYSVASLNWQDTTALKAYLGNETLFQLVCSLAVYPRLDWSLTLALFTAIAEKSKENNMTPAKADYDTLLKIARIPWLNKPLLEDTVRLALLQQLRPATEVIARETIVQLLDELRPLAEPGSPSWQELDLQYKLNTFFLYAYNPYKYSAYGNVKKQIASYWNDLKEWPLKERANSRTGGLMPENSDGRQATVEEFLLEDMRFEKNNLSFLRLALLTVPAITLYILFFILRPQGIYLDQYKPVSFQLIINKDKTCQSRLTHIIIRKQKPEKIALNPAGNNDTLQVSGVAYNQNMHFSLLSATGTMIDFSAKPVQSIATVSAGCND